tara:strand:- start:352 stop:774 length:423 start_codon:yes stop_codon:yes gene_type:complete
LSNKLSNKDKKDWNSFINKNEKLENKDLSLASKVSLTNYTQKIDLHGFSLEEANKLVNKIIIDCFNNGVSKITVITGKGLRSSSEENPYVSKDLSILKHSVPEYIKSSSHLMSYIKDIVVANNEEGGSGAFNIYLKKFKE